MSNTPATFKAFEYTNFGDVLQEMKLNTQVAQKPLNPAEVRVKVISAAVNPLDYKLVALGAAMLPVAPTVENPFRLGFDMAGVVTDVGSGDVRGLKVGDSVFAMPYLDGPGSYGEYINVDANYQALVTLGNLQAGQRVLILGGGCATGMFGIQIAKALGAEVITTASTRNVELVKSLGADQVIEYTTQKWGDILAEHSVDLIYDCGMEPESWATNAQKILKQTTGIFVTIAMPQTPAESSIGATFKQLFNMPAAENLQKLSELIEAGQIKTVIDSEYPLEKLEDAIKLQQSNKARGKIIIEVAAE
ncbi:hypothetical protein BBO99_00009268 [Phytophthora kernoviae]|uniref:Enoyl reductase (ER) domain-containing protein n=2 Tax=Phytophthora kernoviae TaxID=325452 RepID=A0A3R7FVT9_9STRA|nr:hypothetical protein G195_010104 [Phytophthora kernoviae 00238/432]KAG2505785.1 hypothetical protein JM16_009180 [Phytophthora kernoviae]KAG2508697.1 hypothetical protein JM18_009125 [Phytophthora kernoviae]RLM96771.1 hypothetical protein BBI17_009288 [Phytophthora kernoviae]RLN73737.1 hypothetical protein BBO99_00009268 [Phytophthora kernoviae]